MTSEELDKIVSKSPGNLRTLSLTTGWQLNDRQLCKILSQMMVIVGAVQIVGQRAQGVPVSKRDVHAFAQILPEIILSSPRDCPGGGEALVERPYRGRQ